MAYKDPDKQREANRLAQAKFKAKGITKGITKQGITLPEPDLGNTLTTTQTVGAVIPKHGKDKAHKLNLMADVINQQVIGKKRGKEIKTFADLPSEVRRIIEVMSTTDGKLDQDAKTRRTAIAINYQHLFPGRFHSVGVAG